MTDQLKASLQWGVTGGLGMAICRAIVYLISPMAISKWEGVFYLPLLFCMIWGVVTVKRNHGSEISFAKALFITFLISLIGVIINTLFAYALIDLIDPALGERLYNAAVQKAQDAWESQGMTEQQIEKAKYWIDMFYKNTLGIVLATAWQVFVGTIISLIISAFVKHTNPVVIEIEDSNPPV